MTESNFTETERNLLLHTLEEIAFEAQAVGTLCNEAIGAEESAALSWAARNGADKIGMLADMVLTRLGRIGAKGDAENWLLSPVMKTMVDRFDAAPSFINRETRETGKTA